MCVTLITLPLPTFLLHLSLSSLTPPPSPALSLSLSISLSLSPRTPRSPPPPVQEMTLHAEECLRRLGLPYRKVALCAGDVGFSAQVRLLLKRHNSSVAKCTLYIYIYTGDVGFSARFPLYM
jgi:hypothetical protein